MTPGITDYLDPLRHKLIHSGPDNPAIPYGVITLWYGASTAVPTGWAICDGTNGTPDMRGRVAVGVDTGQAEFDVVGEAGGTKTHVLTDAEMPVHTHVQNSHNHTQNSHNHTQNSHLHAALTGRPDDATSTGSWYNTVEQTTQALQISVVDTPLATATNIAATATNIAATAVNQDAGGNGAHNNLQPYRALHYIMKI